MTVLSRIGNYSHLISRLSSNASRTVKCQPFRKFQVEGSKNSLQGRKTKGFGQKDSQIKEAVEKDTRDVEFIPESNGHPTGYEVTPLSRYFLYTAVSIPTIFTGCIIWRYEKIKKQRENMLKGNPYVSEKELGFRQQLNHIWNHLPPGKQLAWSLIAVNTAVFLLWKVPNIQPLLMRYFTCLPVKGHSVLGSTLSSFSHQQGFHLFVNMYVLMSFCTPAAYSLGGKEQLLALFLGGATCAGLTGSMFKVLSRRMIPSVGASGGILSLIGFICLNHPDAKLSIAFVDQIVPHSFSAHSALIGIILLDVTGLFLGWRFLDHAGHLGGTIFGILYARYGKDVWMSYQRMVLRIWHKIRSGVKAEP